MHATTKQHLTLRVPRDINEAVIRIAAEESESRSTIIRRLLRLGLKNRSIERRDAHHTDNEAA